MKTLNNKRIDRGSKLLVGFLSGTGVCMLMFAMQPSSVASYLLRAQRTGYFFASVLRVVDSVRLAI